MPVAFEVASTASHHYDLYRELIYRKFFHKVTISTLMKTSSKPMAFEVTFTINH